MTQDGEREGSPHLRERRGRRRKRWFRGLSMCAGVRFEIFFGCFVHGKGENGRREAKSFFPFLRKQKINAFVHFSLGAIAALVVLVVFLSWPLSQDHRARPQGHGAARQVHRHPCSWDACVDVALRHPALRRLHQSKRQTLVRISVSEVVVAYWSRRYPCAMRSLLSDWSAWQTCFVFAR